jgi:hypothetical protein
MFCLYLYQSKEACCFPTNLRVMLKRYPDDVIHPGRHANWLGLLSTCSFRVMDNMRKEEDYTIIARRISGSDSPYVARNIIRYIRFYL